LFFFVGRNERGHWVVRDQSGRCGGLFINRAEALRFAQFETGHSPQAIVMVSGTLELQLGEAMQAMSARSDSPSAHKILTGDRSHAKIQRRSATAL
jgi:hypothetical protein